MGDANMDAILKRWNFRPIGNNGRLLTDGEPQQPLKSPDKQTDEATREIAQKILTMPDVKL
jgi:hypothetical protein